MSNENFAGEKLPATVKECGKLKDIHDFSEAKNSTANSRLKRNGQRDRRRSVHIKRTKKETKYWAKEDELLLTHIPYGSESTKSPHILINKWFHRLKKNCIVLKNPRENDNQRNRKIFYDVDFIGENVKYISSKKYINFQMENIKQKWILILVKFKDIMFNTKLSFITESGFLIQDQQIADKNDGYVVLATIKHDKKLVTNSDFFSEVEISLAQKFFYNQVKKKKNDYHFNTTGRIHSFGYGPRYNQDPITKYSFAKFANSKFIMLLFDYV